MNVFIVGGAGTIGAATAAWLAARNIVDEVVIFDQNTDLAKSHAMDLSQAVFSESKCKITAGNWEDMGRCPIIVVAAGLPAGAATHDPCQDLSKLMPLARMLCENLNRYRPDAVVLSMTNPLDIFNYLLYRVSGLHARQFIGLSLNDSLRFQWALGELWKVPPSQTNGYVVGEHGEGKISLFSTVKKVGKPARLTMHEQESVQESMKRFWSCFLGVSGSRTAGWTSGAAAGQVVESIMGIKKNAICCSAIEQENQGYSFGWPVHLGAVGVTQFLDLELTKTEKELVIAAREKLKTVTQCALECVGIT